MKEEQDKQAGKRAFLIGIISYIMLLTIAILLLILQILPEDEFWAMMILFHGLLFIAFIFKKCYRFPNIEVTNEGVSFQEEQFDFNKNSFYPIGRRISYNRNLYAENWYIAVRNNESNRVEELSFKRNTNSYRHMAFYLMEQTRHQPMPPVRIDMTPEKETTLVNYILGVSLFSFLITLIPLSVLLLSALFTKNTDHLFSNNLLFWICTITFVICLLISVILSPYKQLKTIYTIVADEQKLLINETSFQWKDILRLKLECGIQNRDIQRQLIITTWWKKYSYCYTLNYTIELQGNLERWLYNQLQKRFIPTFEGEKRHI